MTTSLLSSNSGYTKVLTNNDTLSQGWEQAVTEIVGPSYSRMEFIIKLQLILLTLIFANFLYFIQISFASYLGYSDTVTSIILLILVFVFFWIVDELWFWRIHSLAKDKHMAKLHRPLTNLEETEINSRLWAKKWEVYDKASRSW